MGNAGYGEERAALFVRDGIFAHMSLRRKKSNLCHDGARCHKKQSRNISGNLRLRGSVCNIGYDVEAMGVRGTWQCLYIKRLFQFVTHDCAQARSSIIA